MFLRLLPAGPVLAPLLALVCSAAAPCHGATYQADIVVVGGSMGAPAAALAASRNWTTPTILLTEPTDWLGGQAMAQGVSAIDNAWHAPGNTIMRDNRSAHYAADYLDRLHRIATKSLAEPGDGMATTGTGWVSRECYDPRTGAWALDQMVAARPNITVLKMTVPKAVATAPVVDSYGTGSRITSITLVQRSPQAGYTPFTKFLSAELPDWYSTADSAEGYYIVETFYSEASNRATNAPFTVNHMAGQSTVLLNQTQSGAWRTIGTFQFRGNKPAQDWVLLSNHQVASGQYVAADAVRATLTAATPVGLSSFDVE